MNQSIQLLKPEVKTMTVTLLTMPAVAGLVPAVAPAIIIGGSVILLTCMFFMQYKAAKMMFRKK